MSGLVENFKTGIFSDTLIAVNVKLCKMVLLVELYLFTPLSVTLTILQGHSNVKTVLTENVVLLTDLVKTL